MHWDVNTESKIGFKKMEQKKYKIEIAVGKFELYWH